MKKYPALLFAGILLLTMLSVAGTASAVDSRFVGDWYVHTFKIDENPFNAGDTNIDVKISVEEDGTATWTDSGGSRDTGTWTSEGDSMLISWDTGGALELVYADGALLSVPEGSSLIIHLERYPPNKTPDTRPPWRRDVKAADFDGQWMSIEINVMGMTIPMSELGERVDPLISGGKVTAINGNPVDPSVTTGFIDSTLLIYNPIVDVYSVMNLLEDGSATLMHLHAPEVYFTLIPEK